MVVNDSDLDPEATQQLFGITHSSSSHSNEEEPSGDDLIHYVTTYSLGQNYVITLQI